MPEDRAALTRQVKEASDILAVVSSYLSIYAAGSQYKALCPFHDDSKPSLQVDPKWQNYRCWACGARGDVFTFVMHMEKVDFIQAREMLARRVGIELDRPATNDNRLQLLDVMKWANERYQECLYEQEIAEEARLYLTSRKFTGQIVRQFGLGFAPSLGEWLFDQIRRLGKSFDLFEEVGLIALRKEQSGYYDRFRDRVMFPIHDVQGRTVGFGGRILPNSPLAQRAPKYYNSSDTPLFNKSELLFGLDFARASAIKEQNLIVVEGYTDVMMAHQKGIENVVATMGTALNQKHIQQLRRIVPKVVLVFDADDGGNKGVDRALELFVSQDLDLKIAQLPAGLDPCDWLIADGPDPFRKVVATAKDALDFKLDQLLEQHRESGIEGSRRVVDGILTILALAPDNAGQAVKVKQQLLISRIAQRLKLLQETVWARFGELIDRAKKDRNRETSNRLPAGSVESASVAESAPSRGPAPVLEKQLLEVLLADHRLVKEAAKCIQREQITHPGLRKLLSGLYDLNEEGDIPDLDGLRMRLDHPALLHKAMELQEVGRAIAEREIYLQKIAAEFEQSKRKSSEQELIGKLGGVNDPEAARQMLARLQTRGITPVDVPNS